MSNHLYILSNDSVKSKGVNKVCGSIIAVRNVPNALIKFTVVKMVHICLPNKHLASMACSVAAANSCEGKSMVLHYFTTRFLFTQCTCGYFKHG